MQTKTRRRLPILAKQVGFYNTNIPCHLPIVYQVYHKGVFAGKGSSSESADSSSTTSVATSTSSASALFSASTSFFPAAQVVQNILEKQYSSSRSASDQLIFNSTQRSQWVMTIVYFQSPRPPPKSMVPQPSLPISQPVKSAKFEDTSLPTMPPTPSLGNDEAESKGCSDSVDDTDIGKVRKISFY